jgi:hypothetical protein
MVEVVIALSTVLFDFIMMIAVMTVATLKSSFKPHYKNHLKKFITNDKNTPTTIITTPIITTNNLSVTTNRTFTITKSNTMNSFTITKILPLQLTPPPQRS